MDIQKIKSKINKRLLVTLLLSGICLLLSYIESLIPSFGSPIPYVKLTISGAVIIFALILYGVGEAILVMGISALSVGLIINNSPFMIIYFLIGGLFLVLSTFGLLRAKKFGIIAITVFGHIASVIGQTAMSAILLGTPLAFASLPVNALFSCISGLISGVIVYVSVRFLPNKLFYSDNESK